MRRICAAAVALNVVGLSAAFAVRAQDANAVIAAASAAIGVDALKTVQYSATGFDFALGQSYNPSSPWRKFINKSYTRVIDFQVPASRVERVRLQGEHVVNTHHHFDHSSGLRAFVAEGATVVTHQVNQPFYEKVFTLPRTLNPDRLARSPRKPAFETMTDKKVMTDGNHVIELHHLQGNGHNEGFIVAWLPKPRILVEADAYNPPADPNAPFPTPPSPYSVNLADNIERLKIDPQRIIAVHAPGDGRVVTKAELLRAVGRSAPPTQ